MKDVSGNEIQVAVDISFYNIADYVDDVGIGQHGYCYIADDAGSIVYHPQQQLIYASLKEEDQTNMENGTYIKSNVIYTVNALENCDWHIVGVCYVDEMITNKVERVVSSLVVILTIVLAGTVFLGQCFLRSVFQTGQEPCKSDGRFRRGQQWVCLSAGARNKRNLGTVRFL